MELNLQLTQNDWVEFNKYLQRKKNIELKGVVSSFGGNFILWLFLGLGFVFMFRMFDKIHWPTATFVAIAYTLLIVQQIWNSTKLQKALMPSNEGTFVGKHHFTIDQTGIHSKGQGYKCFHEWSVVKSIERENGKIMIFIDTAHALLFPEEQLENVEEFFGKINILKA